MAKQNEVIILDYDGVLIDSADEVALSAYCTLTGNFTTSVEQLPENYLELFRNNRFTVTTAGNMPILAEWCLENASLGNNAPIPTREEILDRAENSKILTSELRDKFFKVRTRIAEENPTAWVELNRPYEPLWSELKKYDPASFVILTYKNKQAVLEISEHYGLSFPEENIYSGEKFDKIANFKEVKKRFNAKHYHFVDDAVKNLVELKSVATPGGLSLYLACWGYCTSQDAKLTKQLEFSAISQSDLISSLRKWL